MGIIYVAGPYTADSQLERDRNIAAADKVGRDLLAMGHAPIVPHNLSRGWELDDRFQHDPRDLAESHFLRMDLEIINRCDALFFLGHSPGADVELARARERLLPVYTNIDDVPDGR